MGEDEQRGKEVEPLHKRREIMADGRRYIIYYTFGDATADQQPTEGEIQTGEGRDV